jgi:hypothetical protein
MSVLTSLPVASPTEEGLYLTVEKVRVYNGPTGEYARLIGSDPQNHLSDISITVDGKHFELLDPFLTLHEDGIITGKVPIFKGKDGKWRFSTLAATPVTTDTEEQSDRLLRVSFPPDVARKVRQDAARIKVSEHDYVRILVREAVCK